MSKVLYESSFGNNSLVIFEALKDTFTGRRLYDDLVHVANKFERLNYCTHYNVESRDDLIEKLKAVEVECKERGMKPVLHFECHGHPEKGLLIEQTGEYISWTDLMSRIALINAVTRNNTGVVLASCHGFELARFVDINKPSPFHFMVGPVTEVGAGCLADKMNAFYRELIESYDLNTALRCLDKDFRYFVCSWWFFAMYGVYMDGYFKGKGRETLLSSAIDLYVMEEGRPDSDTLKRFRKSTKGFISDPEYMFAKLSQQFMHNEEGLSYETHRALNDR